MFEKVIIDSYNAIDLQIPGLKYFWKYGIHFLVAGLLAMLLGLHWDYRAVQSTDLAEVAESIEKKLQEFNDQIHEFAQTLDPTSQSPLLSETQSQNVLEFSETNSLVLYLDDSIISWSNNEYIPPKQYKPSSQASEQIIRLRNGYCFVVVIPLQSKPEEKFHIVGLLPVYHRYSIENEYLKNAFNSLLQIPHDIRFLSSEMPGAQEVLSSSGAHLFYIINDLKPGEERPPAFSILFFFCGLLLILIFFTHLAHQITKAGYPIWAIAILLACFTILRYLLLYPLYPELFRELDFFNPQYYASSNFIPSLGDFFISTVMLIWLAVFVFRNLSPDRFSKKKGLPLAVIPIIFLFIGFGFNRISELVCSLVIDSNISFDIINFLSLSAYSLVGLLIIFSLLASLFLISIRLASVTKIMAGNRAFQLGAIALAMIILLPVWLWEGTAIPVPVLWIICSIYLLSLAFIDSPRFKIMSFTNVVTWLIFFALFTAYLLNEFNTRKEWDNRKLFASNLMQEDYLAEYTFSQAHEAIVSDTYIRGYFKNPLIKKNHVSERLNLMYFKGHLGRYDLKLHTYLKDSIPYQSDAAISWQEYKLRAHRKGRKTFAPDLYYFSHSGGNYEYLALLDIYALQEGEQTDTLLGRLVIEMRPKSYSFSSVYPELLLAGNIKQSANIEKYDFAIYANNQLIRRNGDYPYNGIYESSEEETYERISSFKFDHLIYKSRPGESIWVSMPQIPTLARISYFSYIFAFYLLIILVAVLIIYARRLVHHRFRLHEVFEFSFRNKIQVFVTFIILASFFMVGYLTITNIVRQYDEYHHQRLLRKVKQVYAGLQYYKNSQDDNTGWEDVVTNLDQLSFEISSLSDIHSMDINLYDNEGRLLVSSQPEIFEKGLLTDLIDPEAYRQILKERKSQYIQNEAIGNLDYLSVYVPITGPEASIEAILNLPYFAKEKNLNEEITDFLIYFINIYVLVLVLAGLVGVIVSKSVTRPIFEIGEKLKKVTLGQKNEPIVWEQDDEIGKLVREYNRMIAQLENSAELLAKSERESAWREMAKQVAHEIKNPLTPMKLSIQHLQRASRDNMPDIDQMIEKVTSTLIEQIENLSEIASEFSSFAKMPAAQQQILSLNEIVRSVSDLYKNEDVDLTIHIPAEQYLVFADKGQLIRVFNNLVKNALQAIPDERKGNIFIAMKQEHDFVLVKVEDNGIGISPEQQEKVFAPNFTTKGSGMGLGLAISKNIINSAGGEIWFESEKETGTRFYVKLPIHSD